MTNYQAVSACKAEMARRASQEKVSVPFEALRCVAMLAAVCVLAFFLYVIA